MSEQEILVISTIGPENPEKLLMPFIVANASMAMDIPVTVFLMNAAVELAVKGKAATIPLLEGMPELSKLMETFFELGGEIKLCGPCCNHRNITSDDLIPKSEIGGAAGLVDMITMRKVVSF